MTSEIREYVKRCDVFQHCNDAKFVKANAALHPIPVEPEVWQQVCYKENCILSASYQL